MVISVLEQKGGHWLSPSRMLKYQVTLLEQDDVELKTTTAVNPAMFLSSEMGESLHCCREKPKSGLNTLGSTGDRSATSAPPDSSYPRSLIPDFSDIPISATYLYPPLPTYTGVGPLYP
ncbi:hypothetical protein QYF61_018184 [Mycteria americana]|uniref:Uncharacterized protein n=1 Tax=Mycteria americana TaxID=33587 RepID=A0AAN7RPH9_MYCAM|nr:hypothetical protein QYF61_018184 [Mycteria americana]